MICEIINRTEKLRIMKECDDSYIISVIERKNFDSLFDKIDRYAIFLCMLNRDAKIIGYSAFYANDLKTNKAFLTLICIAKAEQNKGNGGMLLSSSISFAREKGMKSMGLNVLKQDTNAIAFYTKHGFKKIMEVDDLFILMERQI